MFAVARVLALLLGLATATGAGAIGAETWMSGDEITIALGGKAIDGHYRGGRTFSETYAFDGSLRYRDDKRQSGGHWSVINGSFCTIYDTDPTGGCFRVRRSGANCFEFYFVARTETEAATPRTPDWTARGWLNDTKDTCVEGANA